MVICSTIPAWGSRLPSTITCISIDNIVLLKRAMDKHDRRFGWKSYIDGFHSLHWREIQVVHFKSRHIQKLP